MEVNEVTDFEKFEDDHHPAHPVKQGIVKPGNGNIPPQTRDWKNGREKRKTAYDNVSQNDQGGIGTVFYRTSFFNDTRPASENAPLYENYG